MKQPDFCEGSPFSSAAFVYGGLPYAHVDNDHVAALCMTYNLGGDASGQEFCMPEYI